MGNPSRNYNSILKYLTILCGLIFLLGCGDSQAVDVTMSTPPIIYNNDMNKPGAGHNLSTVISATGWSYVSLCNRGQSIILDGFSIANGPTAENIQIKLSQDNVACLSPPELIVDYYISPGNYYNRTMFYYPYFQFKMPAPSPTIGGGVCVNKLVAQATLLFFYYRCF